MRNSGAVFSVFSGTRTDVEKVTKLWARWRRNWWTRWRITSYLDYMTPDGKLVWSVDVRFVIAMFVDPYVPPTSAENYQLQQEVLRAQKQLIDESRKLMDEDNRRRNEGDDWKDKGEGDD